MPCKEKYRGINLYKKFNKDLFRYFKTSQTTSKREIKKLQNTVQGQGFLARIVFSKRLGKYLLYVKRGRKRRKN